MSMKEHGIIFTAPMVRAILAGAKTQTRRIAKAPKLPAGVSFQPVELPIVGGWGVPDIGPNCGSNGYYPMTPPHGPVARRLWVRETWHRCPHCAERTVFYRAGGWQRNAGTPDDPGFSEEHDDRPLNPKCAAHKWRPAIHMPRWASRITLEVTRVRLERVQSITEEDARAEGVDTAFPDLPPWSRENYRALWDTINGAGSWASNPWCWVYDLKRVQ